MAQRRRTTTASPRRTSTRSTGRATTRRRSSTTRTRHWAINPDVARSLVGVVLLAAGAVTLIALALPGQGRLTDIWRDNIAPWFGTGRWLLPFVLLAAGIYVERAKTPGGWEARLLGALIAFTAALGLIELMPLKETGGIIGTFLATVLGGLITKPGAFIVLLGITIIGIMLMLDVGLGTLLAPFGHAGRGLRDALAAGPEDEGGDAVADARMAAAAAPAPTTSVRGGAGGRRGASAAADAAGGADAVPVPAAATIPAAIPSAAPISSTFASPAPVVAAAGAAVSGATVADADRGTGGVASAPADGADGDDEAPAPGSGSGGRGPAGAAAAASDGVGRNGTHPAPYPWTLPPITLLEDIAPKAGGAGMDHERNKAIIQTKLASFNIAATVVGVNAGPVVTQYEVMPAPEVKVSRIEGLADDLAMALAARTLRIEAPIPGKSVVGIEIPNSDFNVVALRRIAEEPDFKNSASRLTFALGRDVAGHARSVDLAKMPHLLIAGATGSGKSVMVNALITSILVRATPTDVRLILMDLKRVELAAYNGVPHLLVPVITEPSQAKAALKWAVGEMEYRYRRLAGATARNIAAFNESRVDPTDRMPYVVVIIDELADLMMREGKNVEDPIVRLAQKARATGIHMVLATQRPSVNVVTGLIKANFPSRIAFAMASQIDSRTILDAPGAEDLIGRGDMLYQPADLPRPVRLQGVFVSDREIGGITDHWRAEADASGGIRYQQEIVQDDEESTGSVEEQPDEEADRLLPEAVKVIQEYDRASASLLQRRLKIGYARAARIVDQLEARGYVGAFDGSNARQVLRRDTGPAATGRWSDGDESDG